MAARHEAEGERRSGRASFPTLEEILTEARSGLDRLSPPQARAAQRRGAAIIDIRSDSQMLRDGTIPGAVRIPRNVLEWRLEPGGDNAIPELARRDRRLILICHEGYQSSLAAATLRRLGLDVADLIGGVCAWREHGLPVERGG